MQKLKPVEEIQPEYFLKKKETISYVHIIKNPAFIFYILIFGFYFIAEHGILNWFMLYGINGLELEYDRASFFLSIFPLFLL